MQRVLALVLIWPAAAHAERWMSVEVPAAMAVSSVQESVFRPGIMPALGLYTSSTHFAVGLRMRAGILRDGAAPGGGLADPSTGGLATGGLALRAGAGGGWAELVAGGGVTGHDTVPAFEAGAGWSFDAGSLELGPSVRFLQVMSPHTMNAVGDASLVLVGLDVRTHERPHRITHAPIVVAEAPRPPPPPPPPPPADPDGDRVVDRDESCLTDMDGCPISEDVVIHGDRIVLDERVLFDTDHAHVKSRGREAIAAIVKAWRQHPEWKHMTIEGHTDTRGTDSYNMDLSQRRADAVRAVFVRYGADAALLDTVAYGRTRPRDPGTTDEAHARNRRVEFVIEREVAP